MELLGLAELSFIGDADKWNARNTSFDPSSSDLEPNQSGSISGQSKILFKSFVKSETKLAGPLHSVVKKHFTLFLYQNSG